MTNEHKPGCPALGGYGHGKEDCICGASGVDACRAERRADGQGWACDCFHMRPDCKPNLPDGVDVLGEGKKNGFR